MPMPTFILAGTYNQFRAYLSVRGPAAKEYRYLGDEQALWGTREAVVIRVGTWRRRPDLPDLINMMAATQARVVDDDAW